ncbi:mannosyl-oligosaccharide 1,2-alpha-mannosidase [Chondrus crispus]|uniref:alpha-1,2-Mannosidase n=1 Tax=Chondrus crispus TaxID=2769 RepID=R7Q2I5_CHOCR|nr:mannosyl-oligosaccharide 1,2-alpha-mannosidase [Chondrus crispus]CDF32088.1 mannosyl-oligosaccharide 1,2-alpha-mannosidase [Chondrus crispus]|eukprot:XP_005711753.1 mannosyl-oligosaccharide 1,2-alpha-mannosidase [Chondrus crispus]
MRFIAKHSHRIALTSRQRLLRVLYLLFTRFSLFFIVLLFFAFALFFSLVPSPPPAALPHASSDIPFDPFQCGCHDADTCTTAEPVGSFSPPPVSRIIDPSLSVDERENENRRRAVRTAAMNAWDAYVAGAWGQDTLRPLTGDGLDTLGGMGASIVEALGTLYIMRLDSRYAKAREWVEKELHFDNVEGFVNVHEVTTRILGGLISAYQLTADLMFLQKAEDLGRRLSPAFSTLNGVPYPRCRLSAVRQQGFEHSPYKCEGTDTTQSQAGGLSLEFRALGFHSLRQEIRGIRCKAERAVHAVVEAGPLLLREQITSELMRARNVSGVKATGELVSLRYAERLLKSTSGLFGSLNPTSMESYYAYMVELWHGAVETVGAGPIVDKMNTFSTPAKGFYEYLTKAWRQGGGCEASLRYPLDASMRMLLQRAIYQSPTGDLHVRSFADGQNETDAVVEQAMCYLPAVFHLGVTHIGVSARQVEQWREVAEGITNSCINMYRHFPGMLGGESARYNGGVWITTGAYRLQSDLIDALFYMWRTTQDNMYRDEAWKTFINIDRECKVRSGAFTILEESTIGNITKGNNMPSDFMGSTLKMLYLIFSGHDVLSLDNWLFNRVGHPLLVTPGIGALSPCS